MTRPRVYKSEVIVLRRRNLGEADTIFTLFSDREGRFDAIAKGVRKLRSRMRGHLEPIMRTEAMFAQGRTLDVITQAQTVQPYRHVREDIALCAQALYCLELVARTAGEHEPAPGLYATLAATLEALEAGAGATIVRWFEVQLLALGGYQVHLDGCALCHARLPEAETLFSPPSGGLVCHDCRFRAGGGRQLSVRAVKVLRFARNAGPMDFARLTITDQLDEELRSALGGMLHRILERTPGSERYVDEVAALERRGTDAQSPAGVTSIETGPTA